MDKLMRLIKESRQQSSDSQSHKPQIQSAAKLVVSGVSQIVGAASNLIPAGYVDPNDPDIIAEKELMNAIASIDLAGKKLFLIKPVEKSGEDSKFERQILDAAKAIAMASSALILFAFLFVFIIFFFRSATNVQREIASGKRTPDKLYFNDGTWNEGLVSCGIFQSFF
jgi:talin